MKVTVLEDKCAISDASCRQRGPRLRAGFRAWIEVKTRLPRGLSREDLELAKRENPLRVHWKGTQTTREAQNVQRGQKMVYKGDRCKTANGSTQSIQERKIICHHVEKQQKNISHPLKQSVWV